MAKTTTWTHYEPRYQELAARPLTLETVGRWLHDWSELEKDVQENVSALQRTKDEDTRDNAAADAFTNFVREVLPQVESAGQRLKLKLLSQEGYKPTSETAEFVKRFRNEADLFREVNAPLLAEESALSSEYSTLLGGLTVALDGETVTLPEAEKRLLEPDRTTRERAWQAINTAKASVSNELDTLFLKLLELRRQLARSAELPDYRAFAWRKWNRFDYTPDDSLAFHDAISSEVVPLEARLEEERKRTLGLPALRPWDFSVDPQGREPLKPFETVGELEDGVERIFARLDPELAAQFRTMRQGWLELEAREGKVPGLGYQAYFPQSRTPYIYMSATGTHDDVNTLFHEAGHAFHAFASGSHNDLTWNHWAGTEFTEVASQATEVLTLPYLDQAEGGFYSAADAERARLEQLERIIELFPYIAKADAFQHWLYTEASENVSIAEIDATWIKLEKRFAPGADWTGLEHILAKRWQSFHIFAVPFYMLEYGIAWLGAIQIWQHALTDPQTALQQYREALALGGSRPLPELFKTAGATFAFDRKTVGDLLRFVYDQRQAPAQR